MVNSTLALLSLIHLYVTEQSSGKKGKYIVECRGVFLSAKGSFCFLFHPFALNLSFNLSFSIFLSKSFLHILYFFHNHYLTIFPSQCLFHNLSFTIILSQPILHNLSFTILLSQSLFHNLSFTISLSQSFFYNHSLTIFLS